MPVASWPQVSQMGQGILVANRLEAWASEKLYPSEELLAEGMTNARRREFCAGRTAARLALCELGISGAVIAWGAGGEPLWPSGFVGSISHSWEHVAALVAPDNSYRSVGLDIDDCRPVDEAMAADRMTQAEIDLLIELGIASTSAVARRLIFSAKEALFKCQYPLTLELQLDFSDVELCVRGVELGVHAQSSVPEPVAIIATQIRLLFLGPEDGMRVACAYLPTNGV